VLAADGKKKIRLARCVCLAFRETTSDLEHQLAARRGRIDRLLVEIKIAAARVQV